MYMFMNNTCILIYVCMRGSMFLIPWWYGELTQVGIVLLELLVPSGSNATTESSNGKPFCKTITTHWEKGGVELGGTIEWCPVHTC